MWKLSRLPISSLTREMEGIEPSGERELQFCRLLLIEVFLAI
jgi:hypothetical protein